MSRSRGEPRRVVVSLTERIRDPIEFVELLQETGVEVNQDRGICPFHESPRPDRLDAEWAAGTADATVAATSRRVIAKALRLLHREARIEPPRTEPARPMQRTSRSSQPQKGEKPG